MSVSLPSPADPEIASATFKQHLDDLWKTGRPDAAGWGRLHIDNMHAVIALPGQRADGARDWYFLRLGAEYYDAGPPTATFVEPKDWSDAVHPSRWFPVIENRPAWFGLHSAYGFPGGRTGQLICFSFVAQYYMTNHSPTDTQQWQQGKHTVAATLHRLAEVLASPYYRGPPK